MTDARAAVDARRMQVWIALSDLFVDTENGADYYRHAARTVLESGYSPAEIQSILWHELYPVLAGNLLCVAGNWTGWSEDSLREHLRISPLKRRRRFGLAVSMIRQEWACIARHLPAEFA